MGEERRTLRSGEVAKALGLSPATIQSYARNDRIPFRRTPGGQYRYNLDEIRAVLAPPTLEVVNSLPSVFTATGPLVGPLTPYRKTVMSAAALRISRIRGFHGSTRKIAAEPPEPGADRRELDELLKHANGFTAAVLQRDPQPR